jgi:hypothetical protein
MAIKLNVGDFSISLTTNELSDILLNHFEDMGGILPSDSELINITFKNILVDEGQDIVYFCYQQQE